MQSIAESCVRFDAAHLSINLVSEIAVPMFTTLNDGRFRHFNTVSNQKYWRTRALACMCSYLRATSMSVQCCIGKQGTQQKVLVCFMIQFWFLQVVVYLLSHTGSYCSCMLQMCARLFRTGCLNIIIAMRLIFF